MAAISSECVFRRDDQFNFVVQCILREELTNAGLNAIASVMELQRDAIRKAVSHRSDILQQRAERPSDDCHNKDVFAAFEKEDEAIYRERFSLNVDTIPIDFNMYGMPTQEMFSIRQIADDNTVRTITILRIMSCSLRHVRLAVWEDIRYKVVAAKCDVVLAKISDTIKHLEGVRVLIADAEKTNTAEWHAVLNKLEHSLVRMKDNIEFAITTPTISKKKK